MSLSITKSPDCRLLLFFLVIGVFAKPSQCEDCPSERASQLHGKVTDPEGAVIVGATLELSSSRKIAHTARTNSRGEFQFRCLLEGRYHLVTAASTFASDRRNITIRWGHSGQLNLVLTIPNVSSTVTVNSSAGWLNNEHGSGEITLSKGDIAGLANDPSDLLRELQALATATGGASGNAILTVDGFQNVSRMPPKSSIGEVRLNPDLFSAEFQAPPYKGGRIEIYTKPGQENYHGGVFFDHTGSPFVAGAPLALRGAPASKRRYGFELSGPIRSKKSDFSLDLEKRDINEYSTVNATILDQVGPVPLIENIAAPQRLWIASARTGWQLSAKNSLAIRYSATVNVANGQGVGGGGSASGRLQCPD